MSELAGSGATQLASGVIDTIISIAAQEVEGVSIVGAHSPNSLLSKISNKASAEGIETEAGEDGKLHITLHLEVRYGNVLPDLAAEVRQNVADALLVQAAVEVSSIDIFIDAITFDQQ
jgi:uncharacterized alkaline shock family protein YloU